MNQYIQTIKLGIILLLAIAVVWFFKDWQFQKAENIRQTENARQLRISDSLRLTTQLLSTQEINDYLQYDNRELKNKLEKTGIKLNRIESIISTNYQYRDTTHKSTDLTQIVAAIRNNTNISQEVIDTTQCMTTKGIVSYSNNQLKFTVTDRQFKNKSDGVAYWERRQWKFLGVKTRFLGKKQFTAKTFDQCGQSQILKIEKKKD